VTVHSVASLTGPVDAVVAVPGSKSIANRALICAALAEGPSTLRNLPDGDDTQAMLTCLHVLGIGVASDAAAPVTIDGGRARLKPGPLELPTRLAGTTSRFVTALAALGQGPYLIDGEAALRARPMGPLHDALIELGASVRPGQRHGHLPVTVSGPLRGSTDVGIRGDVSSQFITALMLIGPYVPGGLHVTVNTPLVSRPYLEITKAVMGEFGHQDVSVDGDAIVVAAGVYRGRGYTIEPDASSAGYALAAAAVCGGRVEVPGLRDSSLQGDAAFPDVLSAMGCPAVRDATSTVVEGGPLHGVDIDMVDMSDLVPTLAAVALFASSPTRIRGVGFIRAKESDRLGDLCAELRRLGADAEETDDGMVIRPAELHGARLATHHDHRLAMAFGVIGLRVPGVEIEDPDVVTKSWPGYWDVLGGLQ